MIDSEKVMYARFTDGAITDRKDREFDLNLTPWKAGLHYITDHKYWSNKQDSQSIVPTRQGQRQTFECLQIGNPD